MEIKVKRLTLYKSVIIEDGNTKVDLGILDEEEQKLLIKELENAIYELKSE